MIKLKGRLNKNFLLVVIGSLLMSFISYGEEIIEMEYGNEADPEYTTYDLTGGDSYLSDDESIVVISDEGQLRAVDFGETYVHVFVDGQVIESYLVVVYLVHEEETPFGSLVLQPFITGYPNQTFKAEQRVTMAEASVMISRALNIESSFYQPMDLSVNHWAYEGLQCLLNHDMALVKSETLNVNDAITRNQLKSSLEKYAMAYNLVLNEEALNELSTDVFLTRGEMVYYMAKLFNQESSAFIPPRFTDVNVNHEFYYYINQNTQ